MEADGWAIGVDVGGTADEGLAEVTRALDELLKLAFPRVSAESGIAGGAALCMLPGAFE